MKVGLIGFGNTGKSIASILLQSEDASLEWVLRQSTDLENRKAGDFLGIINDESGRIYSTQNTSIAELLEKSPVDVIVDFSHASAIRAYGEEACKRGITIISAISRYPLDMLNYIADLALTTRIIHSPNLSIGVNFVLIAAKILKAIVPVTDVAVIEKHFLDKKEASGTAKALAATLGVEENEIKSVRAQGVVDVHEVQFGFPHQTIHLKHESISHEAFGSGILFALKNLPRRAVGLFTMEDILLPYFQQQIRGHQEIRNARQERVIKSDRIRPWQERDMNLLQFAHRRHLSDI